MWKTLRPGSCLEGRRVSEHTPEVIGLDDDCARFLDIWQAQLAAEQEPGDDEAQFLLEHGTSCPACSLLATGLEMITDPEPLPDGTIDRVLSHPPGGSVLPRYLVAAGAGLVAALLVFGLYVVINPESTPDSPMPSDLDQGFLVMRNGAGQVVEEGTLVQTGNDPVLMKSSPVLALGLASNSGLKLSALDKEKVEVDLRDGTMAAHLLKGVGIDLSVNSTMGTVLVTGTIFSVSAHDNSMEVGVVEGAVRVASNTSVGKSSYVTEGQILNVDNMGLRKMEPGERNAILTLLELPTPQKPPRGPEEGVDKIEDLPADGLVAGNNAGDAGAGRKSSGKKKSLHEDTSSQPDRDNVAALATTPGDYIRLAREMRKTGNWSQAADTYRKVLTKFPGRPESLTVLLPLAELEIDHLGRPDLALGHFAQYVRRSPGGPLAEEAAHGRTLALRALGRRDMERKAVAEFLAKYPGSIHAQNMKSRLDTLSGEKD